jgi:hypothetical protein
MSPEIARESHRGVDVAHHSYLMCPLFVIILIDAESVNPVPLA